MTTRFISLLIALSTMGAATLLAQQEATKPATAGTLTLDKKTYTLKQTLAYETTIDNEDAIAVDLE
ncbi:MAG: hypothetical protein M3Y69_07765, partial [Verrucomicrobiota bacterium]|nr:hypothetical protein [Verrucomicrobiota bacterium]